MVVLSVFFLIRAKKDEVIFNFCFHQIVLYVILLMEIFLFFLHLKIIIFYESNFSLYGLFSELF